MGVVRLSWTTVAFIGAVIIFLWALLKSLGVIQSPTYLEMIPVFGAAVAAGGLIQSQRELSKTVGALSTTVGKLDDKVDGLSERVIIIETSLKPRRVYIEGLEEEPMTEPMKKKPRKKK